MRPLIRSLRHPIRHTRALGTRLHHARTNLHTRLTDAEALVQAGKTPYETVYQHDIMTLRYYPPLKETQIDVDGRPVQVCRETKPVPLVIVAPLAVNMLIYDLFPERSLVRFLRAQGFELYLIDWGAPEPRHDTLSMRDYITRFMPEMLAQVRRHSGQQTLSLHGWSFGGLFSLCYAALGIDHDIANLVLVGAPCDYHANGDLGKLYQRLSTQLQWLENKTGWRVHQAPKRLFHTPGWANALGFKLTNPAGTLQGYLNLLRHLDDRDYVISHTTNAAFIDQMVAYPGGVIQDIIQYLAHENRVAHGGMPFATDPLATDQNDWADAHLAKVQSAILAVAGKQDPIVTLANTSRIFERVSSEDTCLLEVDGGHMGIVSGSRAPAQSWQQISDWLAPRSQLASAVQRA